MAVPKFDKFLPCILKVLEDGKPYRLKDVAAKCADALEISDEDRKMLLPSKRQTVLANRVAWAKTYLKKAGLVDSPQHGFVVLTEAGKGVLADDPDKVTVSYLETIPSFHEFHAMANTNSTTAVVAPPKAEPIEMKSPQEMLDEAMNQMKAKLSDDLMEEIMKITWAEFEQLVVQLLIKMGYGPLHFNQDAVTKKTGDEGIDGIVTADKLGFDSIYVQAKQWKTDATVAKPEIQKFVGALMTHGGTKGIFITTAKFSSGAIEESKKLPSPKIVLVDGKRLAELMIEYNLGVTTVQTYEVKRVDSDFFNEDV